MEDERIISQVDISGIVSQLENIHCEINTINSEIGSGFASLYNDIKIIYSGVNSVADELHEFIYTQKLANRLGQAETKLVRIRQELDKKFGHYDVVRRTTMGIIQADDFGIVRKTTITEVTEELMIQTPGYWLAPCLVALAAWIEDQPELAQRAVQEGMKRDAEKISLFFALFCQRMSRKNACLKWTQYYLARQNVEQLNRATVAILDAFTSGLLGNDSEGIVFRQIMDWQDYYSRQQGYEEYQIKQWYDAINGRRKPPASNAYVYLGRHCSSWPVLQSVLESVNLHADIWNYFNAIYDQEYSSDQLKVQLDGIMTSLVNNYDNEELPLRKSEQLEQYIVDFEGDEERAKKKMESEEYTYETCKSFAQILTDAAMHPESSHASIPTQKFAIALSKEWICKAYTRIIEQSRKTIPHTIDINIGTFRGTTTDGKNEQELLVSCQQYIEREKKKILLKYAMSESEQILFYGGGIMGLVGLIMIVIIEMSWGIFYYEFPSVMVFATFLGILFFAFGLGIFISFHSRKKDADATCRKVEEDFENRRKEIIRIIRVVLAEVVDFRMEIAEKEKDSIKVFEFLEELNPNQYIRKPKDSNRKIRI